MPEAGKAKSRIGARVSPVWREAVIRYCEAEQIPEAELYRRAVERVYGWRPGSAAGDLDHHSWPREGRSSVAASVHLTWDLSEADRTRFLREAAERGVTPTDALVLAVDAYTGAPFHLVALLTEAERAAACVGREDLVTLLVEVKTLAASAPGQGARKRRKR